MLGSWGRYLPTRLVPNKKSLLVAWRRRGAKSSSLAASTFPTQTPHRTTLKEVVCCHRTTATNINNDATNIWGCTHQCRRPRWRLRQHACWTHMSLRAFPFLCFLRLAPTHQGRKLCSSHSDQESSLWPTSGRNYCRVWKESCENGATLL